VDGEQCRGLLKTDLQAAECADQAQREAHHAAAGCHSYYMLLLLLLLLWLLLLLL
jgi:hypothetical protein